MEGRRKRKTTHEAPKEQRRYRSSEDMLSEKEKKGEGEQRWLYAQSLGSQRIRPRGSTQGGATWRGNPEASYDEISE